MFAFRHLINIVEEMEACVKLWVDIARQVIAHMAQRGAQAEISTTVHDSRRS